MGSVVTLYASTAFNGAVQSSVASLIVPQNGRILGVGIAAAADLKTDASYQYYEVSFGSVGFPTSSPVWTILASWKSMMGFVTSGLSGTGIVDFRALPGVRVFAGQYIYLHQNGTNAITPVVNVQIAFDFDQMIVAG